MMQVEPESVYTDAGLGGTTDAAESAPEPAPEAGQGAAEATDILAQMGLPTAPPEPEQGAADQESPQSEEGAEPAEREPTPEERMAQAVDDLRGIFAEETRELEELRPLVAALKSDPGLQQHLMQYLQGRATGTGPSQEQQTPQLFEPETQDALSQLIQHHLQQAVEPIKSYLQQREEQQLEQELEREFLDARTQNPDLTDDQWEQVRQIGEQEGLASWATAVELYRARHQAGTLVQRGREEALRDQRSKLKRQVMGAGAGKPTGPAIDWSKPMTVDEGIRVTQQLREALGGG